MQAANTVLRSAPEHDTPGREHKCRESNAASMKHMVASGLACNILGLLSASV